MKHHALVVVLLCGLIGSGFARAAPTQTVPDNTRPRAGGPGLAVGEPVTATGDPDGAGFGAGCALWLQLAVGGQPQMGQTPLWEALARARTELGRADLQLSPADAPKLAAILGVTHVAVGALGGAEPHRTLTYRLLQAPAGTPVGAPMTLSGTRAQIAEGLPQLARTLARRLGVAAPAVPASTGLTADDLRLLGQIRGQDAPSDAQQARLDALAARSALAGLVNLSRGAAVTNARFNAATQTLLAQAGDNALVWGEIAGQKPLALLPHAAQLEALAARFPGNYNLAAAEVFRCRAVADHAAEFRAAQRVVADAPRSPDGWLTYASTLSSQADDLRQGRYFGALTPAEAATVMRLYPRWEGAARRATQLDPAFAKAWLRLATAATFNSDEAVADHALGTALALSKDKADVYAWALEMYQPKWDGDPAKLAEFVRLASADETLSSGEAVSVAKKLRSSGHADQGREVLRGFITRRRAFLAAHPDDGTKHWGLADALVAQGADGEALPEYQAAARLLPDSAAVRYDLGDARYSRGAYDEALAQMREAIRLDPDYPDAHFYLGYGLKHQGQYDEAQRELRTALRLNPALAKAYAALGAVAVLQNDLPGGIPNYQAAIRLGDYTRANYEQLIGALSATGHYDQVLATGAAALRVYVEGDAVAYDDMADACLHKKDWDNSLALSRATLALNADDPYAHANLAEAYLGQGHLADAQAEWRKVVALPDARTKAIAEGFLKKYP